MIRLVLLAISLWLMVPQVLQAQTLQDILQTHQDEVLKPGRRSVSAVIDDLVASALPQAVPFLEAWRDRKIVQRNSDMLFYRADETQGGITLFDLDTGEAIDVVIAAELNESRPNGGVRRVIGDTLVQFQLSDTDITRRQAAVDAIARSMDASQLAPLRQSIEDEPDPVLKATKTRLAGMLGAMFGDTTHDRIAAIDLLSDDLSVDVRAVLNTILATTPKVAVSVPQDANVARVLVVGEDISASDAYSQLVAAELAPPLISSSQVRDTLIANIADGMVGGFPVVSLDTEDARFAAYDALVADNKAEPRVSDSAQAAIVASHTFYLEYEDQDSAVTNAARLALSSIETDVAINQGVDLGLDALSLASIYFLAAIGLAITFGVMGVINMAHGEFIMMGAYTGFVVQQFVPDYTLSIIVALPLAFAITFGAGVAMERSVIRFLYHRPLETLLATFGISIALQQLAKNIFGTQARPLTSPEWLDGALVINDVIAISYIRIAIFVLALMFLALILFVLKRTRLGLEVRAVTQNPGMAASMGINPDRINMLTFGLGSGIAGIAGVAIGLYAKVTSEMGADYIVQSFMTVVVGGVGNVWGTLAGASLIGFLQKGIEWLNPSNTLAAQTYMILFIILFIQFRPKGIVALKGRAAAD
ncbi:amino acid/amide ABC transporter membrane protein 1, HAAT family [Cognatiyoonia koreensis]|uniref:Amino acid/amide ABC transporter membrane protein 1, HAAT family n=1 Tax=Cognatiyoonia koreensis TaxID=364200 RepID=A0A1I0RBW6_9RHOB|nr:urea ABC transporter permease subunit UrtB [Cognatiyoonia koreensis]SEW38328.1 amino acid/amide ABC transporter membrane protein 1, HAAT family [Cognatiyoonia koreensis]